MLTVEYREVAALVPYARNARTHSEAQIAQIAQAITEFGWTNAILIDEAGGVIAGHGRVRAAGSLGMTVVPTITLSGLTEAQKRAYVIADNKIALNAGWDEELLRAEIADLLADGFDLEPLGFESKEIDAMQLDVQPAALPELAAGERDPFRQMTFQLHDEQAEQVERALAAAKALGPFVDPINENGNANALARICELFLTKHGG